MKTLLRRFLCILLACIMIIPGKVSVSAATKSKPEVSYKRSNALGLVLKYQREQQSYLHFSRIKYTVMLRRTLQLKLNKRVKASYKSSDQRVVKVDRKGMITTKKKGVAVITARYRQRTCHAVIIVQSSKYTDDNALKIRQRQLSAAESIRTFSRSRKTVLLAGSSGFDRWTEAAKAFKGFNLINNAIGGSTAEQWLDYSKDLIYPYKPDAVLLFVGSNDINWSTDGEVCAEHICRLITEMHEKLGNDVPVFYVSMLKNQRRLRLWKEEARSNAYVKDFCRRTANTYYIDLVPLFLNKKGVPIRKYFSVDHLHPSRKGYQIFTKIIGRKFRKVMKGRKSGVYED